MSTFQKHAPGRLSCACQSAGILGSRFLILDLFNLKAWRRWATESQSCHLRTISCTALLFVDLWFFKVQKKGLSFTYRCHIQEHRRSHTALPQRTRITLPIAIGLIVINCCILSDLQNFPSYTWTSEDVLKIWWTDDHIIILTVWSPPARQRKHPGWRSWPNLCLVIGVKEAELFVPMDREPPTTRSSMRVLSIVVLMTVAWSGSLENSNLRLDYW